MRNLALHDALRDFALEAAAALTGELRAGAELRYDVVEEPGRGPVLYNYQPLTAPFIAERWPLLRALPACGRAVDALGSGARAYLRVRGEAAVDSEPALRAMLERLYEGATDFGFPEERFERVYTEVEHTLYQDAAQACVVAPLHGLRLESSRVALGSGLALVTAQGAEAPPEAVWADPLEGALGEPNALVALEHDEAVDLEQARAEAAERFGSLVSGLRLYKQGGLALAPLAWARLGDGPWRSGRIAAGGATRGEPWTLADGEEAELVEFLDAVASANPSGAVCWALRRFELGCERALETEALSDYLLALEALLDADDDAGRASLSLRVAALCAEEHERRRVQRRVSLAFSLERFLIGGGSGDAYVEAIGPESPRVLVLEIEQLLRALLRDLLCGYLDPNLRAAADEILLESGAEIEVSARDLRLDLGEEPYEQPPPDRDPVEPRQSGTVAAPAPAASEPDVDRIEPWHPRGERFEAGPGDSVTASADWDFDGDSAGYGAPV